MKILLDESLPRRLKKDFPGHQVKTELEAGWQGKKNGELMEGEFHVLITSDQNLRYQLNLRNTSTPVIILKAHSNRYDDLRKLAGKGLKLLASPGLERINQIF